MESEHITTGTGPAPAATRIVPATTRIVPATTRIVPATTRIVPAAALVVLTAWLVAACGSGKDYANNPRPPVPIVITAEISRDQVSVSPDRFGAGPIELVVTNQTNASHQLTLETDQIGGSTAGIQQQTGPINPQDTASLKASVPQGTYSVHVERGQIRPAVLQVGPKRSSGQNQLLLP